MIPTSGTFDYTFVVPAEARTGSIRSFLREPLEADPARLLGHAPILEAVEYQREAWQLYSRMFVFTDKRLIFVNRRGLTGSKVEYQSSPYRSITRFSIETAGTSDLDAELKIWLTGNLAPEQLQVNKKLSIYTVQSVLASYVLR